MFFPRLVEPLIIDCFNFSRASVEFARPDTLDVSVNIFLAELIAVVALVVFSVSE